MPISDSDPRVFFAAERTLLAWLRTGLTVVALGFMIARFGLFLHLISIQIPERQSQTHEALSVILGIAFVVARAFATFVAAFQHRKFVLTLPLRDLPPSHSGAFVVTYGVAVGFAGIVLAIYLAISVM